MHYVMGIESGGTKTIAQLARLDGTIVSRVTGPSIADVVPNPAAVRVGLRDILDHLKQYPATGEIRAVYASLGGLNLATVAEVARELLPGAAVEAHRESSGDVVFACAPWWGFDIALMVGTGTVALGCTSDGRSRKVGGWGCWIDDPGSGFEIGREALRAVTRLLDFGAPETTLLAVLPSHPLFRETLSSLPSAVFTDPGLREQQRDRIGEAVKAAYPHLDRRSIASLCPLVAQCAEQGDAVAQGILVSAGQRAADCAIRLARHLGLTAPRVAAMGGVMLNLPSVLAACRDAIREALPAAEVEVRDFTLAAGAVLRALELGGVRLDQETVDRLRRSGESCHG